MTWSSSRHSGEACALLSSTLSQFSSVDDAKARLIAEHEYPDDVDLTNFEKFQEKKAGADAAGDAVPAARGLR